MKVALITRSTLFTVPGGDTVQVKALAGRLEELGIQADIIGAGQRPDYDSYDLLHFFNITRPADILPHMQRSKKPFVLTPIWIDYSVFDKKHRKGLPGMIFSMLPPGGIEYAKTLARSLKRKDRFPPAAYLLQGQYNSIRKLLRNTAVILPHADAEYQELRKRFGDLPGYMTVPNGVDEKIFRPGPGPKENDLVLCAGRIEGVKNQLGLIRALNGTPYRLVLAGESAPNHHRYYARCRKEAGPNVQFIPRMPQEELVNYYRRARVHVLPSWYESCGLASLEAAVMGCRVVVTRNGFASSYFGEDAFYCDPASPASILSAVEKAMNTETNPGLPERIYSTYTWKQAALRTRDAYQKVLSAL